MTYWNLNQNPVLSDFILSPPFLKCVCVCVCAYSIKNHSNTKSTNIFRYVFERGIWYCIKSYLEQYTQPVTQNYYLIIDCPYVGVLCYSHENHTLVRTSTSSSLVSPLCTVHNSKQMLLGKEVAGLSKKKKVKGLRNTNKQKILMTIY